MKPFISRFYRLYVRRLRFQHSIENKGSKLLVKLFREFRTDNLVISVFKPWGLIRPRYKRWFAFWLLLVDGWKINFFFFIKQARKFTVNVWIFTESECPVYFDGNVGQLDGGELKIDSFGSLGGIFEDLVLSIRRFFSHRLQLQGSKTIPFLMSVISLRKRRRKFISRVT